ncbi:MAG: efflux RND transporter periplasmic adaptor subunit [Muribaculaceae bacterium]
MATAVALVATAACKRSDAEADASVAVQLFTVESGTTGAVSEYPGRVKAAEEVNMAFKVSGNLLRVLPEEGAYVRSGQLLAELDPRDYQLQYDATLAEYNKVKAEADRVIRLWGDSAVSADAYDKARYGLQQITAKLDNARNQLEYTRLTAPFDCYVQRRLFEPPSVVSAGMPVVMLISAGAPEVEINLPASAYRNRQHIAGFSARFGADAEATRLPLISYAPQANANGLYSVRLAVPSTVAERPTPGMSVMVSVQFNATESTSADTSVTIPSAALFEREGRSMVWVYADSTVTAREVTVEVLHVDGSASVSNGLQGGERVVSAGVHSLSEGQRVHPLPQASSTNVGGLL